MPDVGLTLTSEQHPPDELVDMAVRAEAAGFDAVFVSDHFHPWLDAQGESPFVWSTLGAIARETETIRVGTAVTCPTIRYHPAIVAQAAASVAAMLDGRFELGLGTGENLNEHITGERWPGHATRLAMLEEAVDVIRSLWTGEQVDHDGEHYTVENARLYTLPEELPPIHVAADGTRTATVAGNIGDGLVSTGPDESVVQAFQNASERAEPPRYGQLTACFAESEDAAREIAVENWANGGLPGQLTQELPTPKLFDQASSLVDADTLGDSMSLGNEPGPYVESIETYLDAGFDHVLINQVNPDPEGLFEFYGDELLPALS